MLESISPALTGLSKRQLRTLASYQRKMGIIQDLEVMRRCVADFVHDDAAAEEMMQPFCRYLQARRARALRAFLKAADRLLGFWPPSRLTGPGRVTLGHNAT
jgi:CHAD domain-containing protein